MADKETEYWLGIDLGTTSVKVVVLDFDGNVLNSESRPTFADVASDEGDSGYEQDPSKILTVAEDVIHAVTSPYKGDFRGVGITGQMHGVMLWSEAQNSTKSPPGTKNIPHHSNLYTWRDQRCSPEFLGSLPKQSDSHQTLSTGYGCATLFWLSQHRQALIKDHGSCGTVMDYLVFKLCGLNHPITSDQLAASFGYFNKDKSSWDEVLMLDGDFPHHLLPHIIPAGRVVGNTTEVLGLPEGIPVFVAMGDVQCAMQAVLSSPHDAVVNISTSIQLGFAVPKEKKSKIAETSPACISFFPYFNDQELALFAGLNGGNVISCFAESIVQWMSDLGIASNDNAASLLPKLQKLSENQTKKTPVASKHVSSPPVINPVLFGERHNKSLRGSVSGLDYASLSNVGLLFHSLSEGVVNHLHCMVPPVYLVRQGIARLHVSGSVPTNNIIVMKRLQYLYSGQTDEVGNARCGNETGDIQYTEPKLEVVMDTRGLESVGSALGAGRVALHHSKSR
ncbi:hypothetical protein EGW08_023482 [Elysia chlorotica]|uniref:Carbohydrate kinase FGGY N-terminal domain-containing protein n=1 Tax=Elysia chlorotica TaxID=188477 RepID=A0A3S1B0C4_ELYCH|nr:hypothetical protein EGW08_023482 [Elysia chlorotica]